MEGAVRTMGLVCQPVGSVWRTEEFDGNLKSEYYQLVEPQPGFGFGAGQSGYWLGAWH